MRREAVWEVGEFFFDVRSGGWRSVGSGVDRFFFPMVVLREAGGDLIDEAADDGKGFGLVAEIGDEAERFDGARKLLHKKVVVVTELGEGRGEGLAVRFACRGQQSGKQHNMLSANVDSEARPKEIEFVITRDGVGRVAGKLVKQFG